VVERREFAGEADDLVHVGIELEEAHLILRAHERVDEAPGGILLEGAILLDAAGGVDGEDEAERQLGLALEIGDLLGTAVFGDAEVVFGELADDGAVPIGDLDEEIDELDVHAEGGGVVLGAEDGSEEEKGDGQEGDGKTDGKKPQGLKPGNSLCGDFGGTEVRP
jgi:hypothetical protein